MALRWLTPWRSAALEPDAKPPAVERSPSDWHVTHVRLVAISEIVQARGLVGKLKARSYSFADAPLFALFSYRQVELGLGEQRLSAKDVLDACATAAAHGCTHAWLDIVCGLVTGETYVHEQFLGTLRESLNHAAAIVVVGDGGCTERREDGQVSEYLCRLWTRYELRAALKARKLHFASAEHRARLLAGTGLGVRSRLLWADPLAAVPPSLAAWPRAVRVADLVSLLLVYFALLCACSSAAEIAADPYVYVAPSAATDELGPLSFEDRLLHAFKVCAVLLPLLAGPLGVRSALLGRFELEVRETATVHRLRRALLAGRMDEAAILADVDPYAMPCFEPCDRLIVAELMGKKAGRGEAGGVGDGADERGRAEMARFWAVVLVQALQATAGKAAFTESGARVLAALLTEAAMVGNADWAQRLLPLVTAAGGGGASQRLRAQLSGTRIVLPAQPAQSAHGGGPRGADASAQWAGLALPLQLLLEAGAKADCDLALGMATVHAGSSQALHLTRAADRPAWRMALGHSREGGCMRTAETVRSVACLCADSAFWLLALIACVAISDDFFDSRYVAYSSSFSFRTVRPVLDWTLVPAFAFWSVSELVGVSLTLLPPPLLRLLGSRGRELRVGRYHGWGGWFLLVEVDLLIVYAAAFFAGMSDEGRAVLVRRTESSVDIYFQTFWDTLDALDARVVFFFFLFVPARAFEPLRMLALAPRWLLGTAAGLRALTFNLVNPHYTGMPFSEHDVLVDASVRDERLPPPPPCAFGRGCVRQRQRTQVHQVRAPADAGQTQSNDARV